MSESAPIPQSVPHTESLEKENRIFDFFEMEGEQFEKFKREVEEHDGLVRVFIHPISEPEVGHTPETRDRLLSVLGRTIRSEVAPPIIVLEEYDKMNLWKVIFKDEELKNDIYLLGTVPNDPYPVIPGQPMPVLRGEDGKTLGGTFEYAEASVKMFVEKCAAAGVKKILIGGTSLEIRNGELDRCIGNFIVFLQEYSPFEIKVSTATAPLNRNDLRDSNPDLV